MSIVTVVAKLIVKVDAIESVKAEMLKLIKPTRQEVGCIEYRLHQDNDDPAVFVFYETWESLARLENHMKTEHFKNYVNTVGNLFEEKLMYKMTRIE